MSKLHPKFIFTVFSVTLSFLFMPSSSRAEQQASTIGGKNTPYIALGTAKIKKTVLAFPEIRTQKPVERALANLLRETFVNDMDFMNSFTFLNSSAFVEDSKKAGIAPNTFKFPDWTGIGAEYLLKSALTLDPKQNVVLEARLYDTFGAKQVLGKRYITSRTEVKKMAHTLANEVVEALTGLPGIFRTRIAMSCDKGGKKEIYIMNFDGTEVKQVTHHRSIAFGPAWHPSGDKLAYSLYTRHAGNIKNIDLIEFNFDNNTIRTLSNRKGINSGPAYSPDGTKLAATLSFEGNPDLYMLDPENPRNQPTRLTHSLGFDVDPSWSKDGKQMAFVSSRAGVPMVYRMNPDGSGIERLTYAGKYNASPSWSPQDNKIAFAGWIDKSFDIFTMNPDGTHIERLTKSQGGNEDPTFSPDGNFIAFSSNRTGQKNIYVMNIDGSYVKRLTYGLGNCVSPKWSPLTKADRSLPLMQTSPNLAE